MLPLRALAYDFSAVAPSGQTLYYNIVNGEAHVAEQSSNADDLSGSLTIPSSVSYGGITYNVTSIGNGAFNGCSGLTSVTIPSSVTSIGINAFNGCSGLARTFYTGTLAEWCTITFASGSSNPVNYSNNLYINNEKITTLNIPEGIQEIKDYAFVGCSSVVSVTLPNSLAYIGNYAFSGNNLSSIVLPNSLSYIGDNAFSGNPISSIKIPDAVAYIGARAFDYVHIREIYIGHSVTTIEENAIVCYFGGTLYFNAVQCTSSCPGLYSDTIILGDSVLNIPSQLFTSNLKHLTIGKSISSLDDVVLSDCTELSKIILRGAPPATSALTFENVPSNVQIEVPCGMFALYQVAPGWSNFSNITETGVPQLTLRSGTGGTATVVTDATCENLDAVIRADAEVGYRFSQWSDGNTDNPRTVNMSQARTLTAQFTEDFVTVSAAANIATGGMVTGAGRYVKGDTAVLSALPRKGYVFDGWSNDVEDNPYTIVLTSDSTITALFSACINDTITVYDTTMVHDTMIAYLVHISDTALVTRYVYDSATVNNTYYDTFYVFTHAVDTMHILDTMIVNHFQYDTVIRNVYQYDTTIVNNFAYDTSIYNSFRYDTTLVFDTMIVNVYNFDTSIYNRYQFDTTHINVYYYDTTLVSIFDTVIRNVYQYDTTIVNNFAYDTSIYNSFRYDTTMVFDTMIVNIYNFDTSIYNRYQFDTVIVNNYRYDTVRLYYYDTITNRYFDTVVVSHYYHDTVMVNNYIYDTIYLNRYIFDTVYLHDTVYVTDQQGVEEAIGIDARIYQRGGQVVVEGAEGLTVVLYDTVGRQLATRREDTGLLSFEVPASGAYLVRIGNAPAQRIVVVR